ncbi:MAG: class I SAM-dependent rRNA methyltransferase [Planctomycetota bacterium]
MTTPKVRVIADRLPRGPWIYARQVERPEVEPSPGALVEVVDDQDRFVGHAHFNPSSDIRLRMLWRGKRSELQRPREFLERRLAAADRLRRKVLGLERTTDVYRLVHAEGDGLSGLIVDRLGDVVVCEHHALGFWNWRDELTAVLSAMHGGATVVHRMPERAARREGLAEPPPLDVRGHLPEEVVVHEHGVPFAIRPGEGHKTGFFCDQRDNRALVRGLAEGRRVADVCCNAGGFALNAARGGARSVTAVDLDEKILELARRSAELGGRDAGVAVEFVHEDAFSWLRAATGGYGLVVLDPPKWAASKQELEAASRRYLDLNALGISAAGKDGLVATFSCSGSLDLPGFLGIVFAAARRSERRVQLLATLGAGADHPQDPDFARSSYLKGALLRVE